MCQYRHWIETDNAKIVMIVVGTEIKIWSSILSKKEENLVERLLGSHLIPNTGSVYIDTTVFLSLMLFSHWR